MIKTAPTALVTIFIAGDYAVAKSICRRFCLDVGLCVTIEPTTYVYTGGCEDGVRIGLINYPRFPKETSEIVAVARLLAHALREGLAQHSFSIVGPDLTEWNTTREVAE
ncbi:conserved hypothetical protein [uncultured Pleomorphomonas sp.]|uniref:Uncharacterized protein n=1 Tax=uncultured Pleomorphomonas sp. TaxID=442121 RepID=A0A212L7A6_9HYPH|nr:hypothetical protein [uncultured Pleomorphomonas sp.]SCM73418.1 conserved hypothetical protein [uncultured Pleomorphomonas sp.]